MVHTRAVRKAEGVAGEFRTRLDGHQVVPPGERRWDAEAAHGSLDHAQLPVNVVGRAGEDKGDVQVPQVVEHRAAAGAAPGQPPAFGLQQLHAALLPGVLVAADDHGILVLPQVEYDLVGAEAFEQQRLHGQVVPGVEGIARQHAAAHASHLRRRLMRPL